MSLAILHYLLSPETPRKAAEFATALAAQIAANSKVAGFAVWLFEVVIENVSPAALADSELPFVNWQMLNGCLASLGS